MSTSTKQAIKKAFLALLEQKPLSKITVKDIVAECNVNRNSFYYYYEDLNALFEEVIKDEADVLIKELPVPFTLENAIVYVLDFIENKKKMVYHIWHSSNREQYEVHLIRICEYTASCYVLSIQDELHFTQQESDVFIDLLKCEFMGQILEWIHQDMAYNIGSHAEQICQASRIIVTKYYSE